MTQKINEDPQLKQGYIYAVRLLAASKKSESELSKRLQEKGYPKQAIEGVIGHLKETGLLSDQKLVNETVQSAIQAKRYGKRRIFMELKRRGVGAKAIDGALELYTKEIEKEIAFELAQGRWEKFKNIDQTKRKKRVYDFLLNRGFDFELSRELINKLESQNNEDI